MNGTVQTFAQLFLIVVAPLIVGGFAARHSIVAQRRPVGRSLGIGCASAAAMLILLGLASYVLSRATQQ